MDGTELWVYKQSIVATDYDSYAVIVACRHIFDDKTKAFGRDLMAQVWSRNQTLTKDVQDVLVSFLSGYDVDPDSIKIVDRTNCA
ncbi:hypothetical protein C0J52_11092 [Blattella germanica]|nr:hypothetical protein C0J52_11092 [Blattella germanica]